MLSKFSASLFCTLCCLTIPTVVCAENKVLSDRVLTIYTEQFPPYNFRQEGKVVGINIAISKRLCQDVGVKCEFVLLPWSRSFQSVLHNEFSAIVSISPKPERLTKFQWVGPVAHGTSCFFKLKRRDDIHISSVADATKYTVGTPRDGLYRTVLQKMGFSENLNMMLYNEKHADVKQFSQNRLDLIIGSANSLPMQLLHTHLTVYDVMPVWVITDSLLQGNYIGFNNNVDSTLVNDFQNALTDLVASGEALSLAKPFFEAISTDVDVPDALKPCLTQTMGNQKMYDD